MPIQCQCPFGFLRECWGGVDAARTSRFWTARRNKVTLGKAPLTADNSERLTKSEDAPRALQFTPRHGGRDRTISDLYWRGRVNVKGRSLILSLSYVSILRCGWPMDVGRCSLDYACPYTWSHNLVPVVSEGSISIPDPAVFPK